MARMNERIDDRIGCWIDVILRVLPNVVILWHCMRTNHRHFAQFAERGQVTADVATVRASAVA